MGGAVPPLLIRLHGVVLNLAQGKFYLTWFIKCRIVEVLKTTPGLPPFTAFPVNHSLIFLSFDAM
jgi:hypothetical protein